jgi:hypothetical protein
MNKLLQKAAILGSTLGGAMSLAVSSARAQIDASDIGGVVSVNTGGVGFTSIGQAMSTIISFVIFLGALIAFVFLVIGAFRYVSAGDDAAGTKAARTIITNAVVGLILLALVYVIFQIIIRVIPGLSSFFAV